MLLESTLLLTMLLGCGGEEPVMTKVRLPKGPNVKTPSPTTTEPYQVVLPKRLSWSPDGGVVHYQLMFMNRKGTPKEGWTVIGYFVDVSTGKTVATYNWEKSGFMCPSLAPLWKKGRSRKWAVKFLKDHAFVKPDKKSKRTRHPDRKAGITLTLTSKKTPVGWISSFRTRTKFRWEWSNRWHKTTAEDKLDARIQLQLKKKGVKGVTVLHTHQPYLNYHYSLSHTHTWKQAIEREEGENPVICEPGKGLSEAECRRAKRKHGLTRKDRYPFTGEVWLYWSPRADALLAFWDDRQSRGLDTETAHGVYRSYVTVHPLKPRKPSPLIALLTPAPKAAPSMKAGSAMKTSGATKSPAMTGADKTGTGKTGTPSEMANAANKKAAKAHKKGCGCRQAPAAAFPGFLLMALIFTGLYLRTRRRASRAAVPVVAVAALLMGAGCFGADSLKSITSGAIGCPTYEITIFNDNPGFNQRSWSARCRGKVYRCSAIAGGKYAASTYSCREDRGVRRNPLWTVKGSGNRPQPRRRAPAGCQFDNQCKGNRICSNGRCMAPSAAKTSGAHKARAVPRRAVAPVAPVNTSFGFRLGITLDDASKHVTALGLKVSRGAVVLSVKRGGAAGKRNLRRGDVIVGLSTVRVKGVADVTRLNRSLKKGQKFHLIVKRGQRIFSFYMRF